MDYDYGSSAASLGIGFLLGFLAIIVLMVVIQWKVYAKAGEPGWACLVPIYNYYVLFRMVGMKPWIAFLTLVPLINFVAIIFVYIAWFKLAKAFGKDAGFGVGLLLLNPIFLAILAFGDANYVGIQTENTTQTPTM